MPMTKAEEAKALAQELLADALPRRYAHVLGVGQRAPYGPNHHETALTRGYLATVLWDLGRTDEAVSLMSESQAVFVAVFGPDHGHSRWAASCLADWQG
jgi:HD superfamily phosphohydrolase YqeK